MAGVTVAVIDPAGRLQLHHVPGGFVEQLAAAVTGQRHIETPVHASLSVWHAERPHDPRPNPLATALVVTFAQSQPVRGTVVIAGGRADHDRLRSLTNDQLAALQTVSRFWLDHQKA